MRAFRAIVLFWALLTTQSAAASEWEVVEPNSRIGFVATYDGIPFEGWFRSFDARIRFDPAAVAGSFEVRINTASVDSNSRDRDDGMRQGEWFGVEAHPVATFRAERFERTSGDRYRALGELSIKGNAKGVEVPFAWRRLSDDEAVLEAETVVDRRAFDIGSGDWADDDTIGFEVTIVARLRLSRR